ncbi:NAD(P)/FAD-dependent oxidoreductase [Streptomyces sp. NPDC048330]|uniref:NAD(P)/FAD-dependent oxidoreductase n=1 Tax=Streptomyces sp. NPDC048330 TaxID=3365533 RepID=UPI0037192618
MTPSVLVVGAGIASISLCTALRTAGHQGRITVVGAEPELPYDRPPLSKTFLTGTTSSEQLALRPPSWYEEQRITMLMGTPTTLLDPEARRVELADGTKLDADIVVLATGGTPRTLPVPDGPLRDAVRTLRTHRDAEALRARMTAGTRLLVIGAGLIGAETAASASQRGCRVTLVDPDPLPMARAVGPEAAAFLHAQHTDHGVRTITAGIKELTTSDGTAAVRAALTTGEVLEAELVLVGIGITANTDLAQAAGAAVDRGVLVTADMRSSLPGLLTIGDAARPLGPDGPRPRIEHWDNARRTGERAARTILALPEPPPRAPWFWTDRYGRHLEMAGHYDPEAEPTHRGNLAAGDGSILFLRDGHCVGAVSVDRPNDIKAAQRLIDRRIPVTAVQVADDRTPLRTLLA